MSNTLNESWLILDNIHSSISRDTYLLIQPFKRQLNKMVKHTQTIRRLLPPNCLSVFDHFVELVHKGLSNVNNSTND